MKNLYKSLLLYFVLLSGIPLHAQVPDLSSYTSASAVLYLDFDGQYVTGTMWNTAGPISANPSGLDNTQITEIFDRVAEDYRPFNINVTTSATKYNAAPVSKRMRVVITTSNEWYGSNAGGVAYINSFSWGNGTPCFVFSNLLNYNVKNIAEAASHEAGHTFGLRHQASYDGNCIKISDYNWGNGSGEIGWAPIMGAGYYQNMTLWNNGPSSIGCASIQSDISIITNATNGFGLRPDDHAETFSSSTSLSFDSNDQFTINGVIEQSTDKDMFKFVMPSFGRFQLNALPYSVGAGNSGSDLDMRVELIDKDYNSIGLYNPGNLLSSVVDSLLSAGTYYLKIDGTGNIYAPEYGSLGSYSLQGTFTDGSILPIRRVELKGRLDGDIHNLSWLIDADEPIRKQVIEVSSNGRNFIALEQPTNALRTFGYRPAEQKPLLYRLHITFESNKEYYSNVIAIRQNKSEKPQLIGNIVTGSSLNVSSPGNYNFQVLDQSGRIISKGNIEKGFSTISIATISGGIYIIRFNTESEQWSEKFIKR